MRPPESFIGQPVRSLQTMLQVIQTNDETMPTVIPDGIYGPQTMTAVSAFQRNHDLPVTGVADRQTWDRLVEAYQPARTQQRPAAPIIIQMGAGQCIMPNQQWYYLPLAQAMLTVLSQAFPEIPTPSGSGTMDGQTCKAMEAFQHYCGLPETGTLDKESWKHLAMQFTPNANRLERMHGRKEAAQVNRA